MTVDVRPKKTQAGTDLKLRCSFRIDQPLMPDSRKHRGPGPQDAQWFGSDAAPVLANAVADLSWLLTRGYAELSSRKLVGDRYRLVERQRTAVLRSASSDAALADRKSREISVDSLRGQPIRIDGFNLILTLESAIGGGIVLGGRDGCYRDLASVHGTYRRVEETLAAASSSRPLSHIQPARVSQWRS